MIRKYGWIERIFGRCFPGPGGEKKILVFGDSNSARNYPGKEASWPVLLENMAKGGLHVINESIDGRTTGFDSGQLNGRKFFKQILDLYPAVDSVIFFLGTNDFKTQYGSVSPEQTASNIMEMIESMQARNRQIKRILLTPPPVAPNGNMTEDAAVKVAELASLLHQVGVKNKAPVLDLYSKLKPARHLADDGVHLNGKGRKVVASLVYRHLCKAFTP